MRIFDEDKTDYQKISYLLQPSLNNNGLCKYYIRYKSKPNTLFCRTLFAEF